MKLNVIIANPAGNITAFVTNEEIPKEQYHIIASKLMELKSYRIEQVGFVKPPVMGGQRRLEMMGGEFCGNAARSFGKLIAMQTGADHAVIEITGTQKLMNITVDMEMESARAEMPVPQEIRSVLVNDISYPIVLFEGICHVVVELDDTVHDGTMQAESEQILKAVQNQYHPEAAGVLYIKKIPLSITPVVWVRDTDSLVWENSCGSGSVALAAWISQGEVDGTYAYEIKQPAGTIVAEIIIQGGRIIQAFISGIVSISEEIELDIE